MRTSRNRYLPSGTDRSTEEQRIAEAAATLPPGGAVTGWAALRLHGGAFFDGLGPDGRTPAAVPVRLPDGHHHRPTPGVRHLRGTPTDVVLVHGVPCLAPAPALLDAMRLHEDVRDAVVDVDMAAAAQLTSPRRMREMLESRPSWRGVPGVPLVREALALADQHSASPPETRMRLVWLLDAGLPRPLVNQPVFDRRDGSLVAVPDLLDLEAGLVVEYDGDDHRSARRHSDDVDREARLREHLLEVTRSTGRDVRNRAHLAARFRAARERARYVEPGRRTWTIGAPPWYRPPTPLDVLLDLRGAAP